MSGELEAAKRLPLRQVPSVKQLLINDHARDQLAAVAAKHMNPERMMRVVANAIRVTPKLQDCEPISFLGALMQCAALGLEPNTVLGHAYLIPFENSRKVGGEWVKVKEVQVIIGYKGLIDLARRYYGPGVTVRIDTSEAPVRKTRAELRDMAAEDPVIAAVQSQFQARIMEVRPVSNGNS
jgi:phage RecT family recombinase